MNIPSEDIQVLSPTRRHDTGTQTLNRALQAALNPPAPGRREKAFGDFSFREGDRVMQIRNNYDIMWKRSDGLGAGTGIFNGDVGKILKIDPQQELMTVVFDDREAEYSFDMRCAWTPTATRRPTRKTSPRANCEASPGPASISGRASPWAASCTTRCSPARTATTTTSA